MKASHVSYGLPLSEIYVIYRYPGTYLPRMIRPHSALQCFSNDGSIFGWSVGFEKIVCVTWPFSCLVTHTFLVLNSFMCSKIDHLKLKKKEIQKWRTMKKNKYKKVRYITCSRVNSFTQINLPTRFPRNLSEWLSQPRTAFNPSFQNWQLNEEVKKVKYFLSE